MASVAASGAEALPSDSAPAAGPARGGPSADSATCAAGEKPEDDHPPPDQEPSATSDSQSLPSLGSATDVIPLGPPTEYRLGRDVRKVSVTIVDKESQPLRDEHGYPYNLWWQYKDDRGWKNFDLEANEDILNLWQKPHERECWKEVLAWDGRRFQTTHVNSLKMTASFQDKQKLMRLVILEAYL